MTAHRVLDHRVDPAPRPGPAVLEMRGIEKSYAGTRALRGASLRIEGAGTVHTLIGQNGCGKSSMLGVLSGQVRPDAGQITLFGEHVVLRSPAAAVHHGIAMVSQETAVAEHLTITENILLGRLVRGRAGVDWPASRRRASEVLARLGLDYDPRREVRTLRPDQRQMVEIARAISMDARLLILDEPTSSLSETEVHELFAAIRSLSAHDVSVLFVSHRLPEVFEVSDSLTVMRDGVTVSSGPISDYTTATLVDQMVGEPAAAISAAPAVEHSCSDAPVLRVRAMASAGLVRGIDLDLAPGEVVGIAGLAGSGRNELLQTIFGLHPVTDGSIEVTGVDGPVRSPHSAIAAGVAYVPADRKVEGLVLPMSVKDNMTIVATRGGARLRTPARRREQRLAAGLAHSMRLRSRSLRVPVRDLSGGNQQKVALGKWLAASPRILLLDDPTRGVDVAAKAEIHALLRRAAADGMAILVTSSEIPELLEVSDRIAVMRRGQITAWFDRADATEPAIATEAAGGRDS